RISTEVCLNFLEAWREDRSDWQRFLTCVNGVGSTREAMDFLLLKTWTLAGFGDVPLDSRVAAIDGETTLGPAQDSSKRRIPNLSRRSNRPKVGRNWRSPAGSKPS